MPQSPGRPRNRNHRTRPRKRNCQRRRSQSPTAARILNPMSEVTRILSAIEQGDPHAAEQLLPLVYDELRKLAAQKLAQEAAGQTLQADRPGPRGVPPAGRRRDQPGAGTAAATSSPPRPRPCAASSSTTPAASGRAKRGGGRKRVDLDDADLVAVAAPDELLALDEALDRLAAEDARRPPSWSSSATSPGCRSRRPPRLSGISRSTADEHWAYARAWLHCRAVRPRSSPPAEKIHFFVRTLAGPMSHCRCERAAR